jgi:predicted PurR-regulated permease PerM
MPAKIEILPQESPQRPRAPRAEGHAPDPAASEEATRSARKTTSLRILASIAIIAFLYFARPVMLPLVGACMVAAGLTPLMRLFSYLRIPTVPSAVIIFLILVALTGLGLARIGQPAVGWVNDAPRHLTDLRARIDKFFPNAQRTSQAVAAVTGIGAAEAAKGDSAKVQVPESSGNASSILSWTGSAVAQLGEMLVLVCLLLAGGDTFTKKLIGLVPRPQDKKRVAEICHEMRHNISTYMFSVSLINISLGGLCFIGFLLFGLPKAGMWATMVILLNFVPYFGPIAGIALVATAGLLSFDTLSMGIMPAIWYLGLHLLEANFVTPIVLSRRFSLNPVVIFFSLMFGLWIWGVAGALLAVPILVSIKTICCRIPSVSVISEIMGR